MGEQNQPKEKSFWDKYGDSLKVILAVAGVVTAIATIIITSRKEPNLYAVLFLIVIWFSLLILFLHIGYGKKEYNNYRYKGFPLIGVGFLFGIMVISFFNLETREYVKIGFIGTYTPTITSTETSPLIPTSPSPTSTETPTLTPTSTLTLTPTPTDTLTPTQSVKLPPAEIAQGTCDEKRPPCIYYYPVNWNELAIELYGDPGWCKWPDVANFNRKYNGHYLLPLQDKSVIMLATSKDLPPLTTDFKGHWDYIPSCQETNKKPCLMEVPNGIFGSQLEAYKLLAEEVYGKNDKIFADSIMQANLTISNNCADNPKLVPITLSPGITVVIPIKPLQP